ncbi:MAG: type I glyceraldehyde-3-phosphate dehydrogenase [bacterium]
MSKIKIGLNGFGRIGLTFTRIVLQKDLFDIALINTRSSSPEKIASMLKNDYVYGDFLKEITTSQNSILIEDKEIQINQSETIENIPWDKYGVNIVVDATGVFLTEDGLKKHIKGNVKKVILTAISKDEKTVHVVLGVNDNDFGFEKSEIISNCSCTTNSVALLYKVLLDNFGIKSSFFTTVHAYTKSQISLKDLSKLKAAELDIIPAATGASKGVYRVMPELSNKIQGMALRVPVPTVSFSDITAILEKPSSKEEINSLFEKYSQNKMKGVLGFENTFKVSSDLIGSPFSCIFDANYTEVIDGNFIKITGWYDNEWGYSSRLVDLIERLSKHIQ